MTGLSVIYYIRIKFKSALKNISVLMLFSQEMGFCARQFIWKGGIHYVWSIWKKIDINESLTT